MLARKLIPAVAFIAVIILCAVISYSDRGDVFTVDIPVVGTDVLVEYLGGYYLTADDYVDIRMKWEGNGDVMFLSSTQELSPEDVSGLVADEVIALGGRNSSRGLVREINGKETMLELCSSDAEFHWGLGFVDDGGSIYSYGDRFFYVVAMGNERLANIKGTVKFCSA